jgi:hypothetical protein
MKRMSKLLAAILVVGASITGVALAAASPTVSTGPVAKATNTTVVLEGHVNPNGAATDYLFSFGPTAAYGANSTVGSAGAGSASVAVSKKITGLTPGTVYHYRLAASNSAGSANGADRTFKTTGHPPAAVLTGPAVTVGKSIATPTGSIDPNGAITPWEVQYGLTTSYGSVVVGPSLPAGTTALPVSVQITGLASKTLFHYRIVAFHGSATSYGADQTFFTEPLIRPTPYFTTRTTPSRDARSPYTFTTGGTLHGNTDLPAVGRCTGHVGIRYYNGRRQVAYTVATVGGNCKFTQQATFRRTHGNGPTPLRVTVDFRGNGYLGKANKVDHVTAG